MTMALVIFLLTFACLVLWLFGLVKPTKVFLGAGGTRSKVTKVYGLGFVALLFAFVIVAASSSSATGPTYP
ncbi:MAG: hypothetical protein WA968_10395, partial [Castellaniella sp.]